MEEHHKKANAKKAASEYQQSEESRKSAGTYPVEDTQFKPEVTLEAYEAVKADLDKAVKEASTNLDGWQRERAEFVNYKKRIERENAQLRANITGEVIKKYLVIMDDLDLAMNHRPTCDEGAVWAEGIELIVRKLQTVIDAEGIERINQNKVQFDPSMHEAISNEDNPEFASGEVIEVVRQGYKLGERILRPAMVRVAR
ncbi:MAG: nucleotide exchange factor GrpE [Chloroflexi bacterium HGW-Chloroflexi-4]|jgi:molecular chaperone GrpE|nr:MAG: nucleotide exchange factor GrpE [Chloroflexi bacterium HGW-Chloroflexi-4]